MDALAEADTVCLLARAFRATIRKEAYRKYTVNLPNKVPTAVENCSACGHGHSLGGDEHATAAKLRIVVAVTIAVASLFCRRSSVFPSPGGWKGLFDRRLKISLRRHRLRAPKRDSESSLAQSHPRRLLCLGNA